MTESPLLRASSLSLTYRALPVLRNVDWVWARGEQWALLGPNGSGKTSLARVLAGLAQHFAGDLALAPTITGRGVAYVAFEQGQALCARDRRLDMSEYAGDASDEGTRVGDLVFAPGNNSSLAARWAEELGLGPLLDRGIRFLSTGELRKALLAAALASEPGLLILDSPLDGLDRDTKARFSRALESLLAGPLPILSLCRSLGELPGNCSHILLLDAGRCLAAGPRRTVLEHERLGALLRPGRVRFEAPPRTRVTEPWGTAADSAANALELRSVSVAYGGNTVLKELDWCLPRGQHCLVTGPNGCGKSTLLSLLTGDNPKGYGQQIRLFGRLRGSGESVAELRALFGRVDNNLHLQFARGLTVEDVVLSGFFDSAGLYDRPGDAQRLRARGWLRAFGLADRAGGAFDGLSFGTQRLVLLARAMVKGPPLLLLDEPTLGLDEPARCLFLAAVEHIARHTETQLVLVSHSPGDVPRCIDQWLSFEAEGDAFRVRCRPAPDQSASALSAAQSEPQQ